MGQRPCTRSLANCLAGRLQGVLVDLAVATQRLSRPRTSGPMSGGVVP